MSHLEEPQKQGRSEAEKPHDAAAEVEPAYDIYREVPVAFRITRALNRGLVFLVGNGIAAFIRDVVTVFLIALITSDYTRNRHGGILFGILIVVVDMAIVFGAGYLAAATGLLEWAAAGRPLFGRYGGSRALFFKTGVYAADELTIEFPKEDEGLIDQFLRADAQIGEALLKSTYLKARRKDGVSDDATLEKEWSRYWNTILHELRIGRLTYGDILNSKRSLVVGTVALRLAASFVTYAPIYTLAFVLVVWLSYEAVRTGTSLVLAFDALAVAAVATSIGLYLLYCYTFSNLTITFPDSMPTELESEFGALRGKVLRPIAVSHTSRYLAVLRDAFARGVSVASAWNAVVFLVVTGISFGVGWLTLPAARQDLINIYGRLALIIAAIPIAMAAIHYFTFWALQNFRWLLASFTVGVVVALLPLGASFAQTGQLPENSIERGLSAVSGAIAGLVTVVASRLKGATTESR